MPTTVNGPFTVTEHVINDDTASWLEMSITVSSGPIRLQLIEPMQRRQVQLRAELAALRMIADEISKALASHEEGDE